MTKPSQAIKDGVCHQRATDPTVQGEEKKRGGGATVVPRSVTEKHARPYSTLNARTCTVVAAQLAWLLASEGCQAMYAVQVQCSAVQFSAALAPFCRAGQSCRWGMAPACLAVLHNFVFLLAYLGWLRRRWLPVSLCLAWPSLACACCESGPACLGWAGCVWGRGTLSVSGSSSLA